MTQKIGEAAVDLHINSKGMYAGLSDAEARIHRFSKDSQKELGNIDGDFLSKIAQRSKDIRLEHRRSGESSLASMLGGGLTDFGVQALGLGVAGVAVDALGKSLASAGDMLRKISTGEVDAATAMNEWGKGLPIVGGFVSAFTTLFDLTTGEAGALRELGTIMAQQESTGRAIGLMNNAAEGLKDVSMTPHEKALAGIESQRKEGLKKVSDERQNMTSPEAVTKSMSAYDRYSYGFDVKWGIDDEAMKIYNAAQDKLMGNQKDRLAALSKAEIDINKTAAEAKAKVNREYGEQTAESLLGIDTRIASENLAIATANARDAKDAMKLAVGQIDAKTGASVAEIGGKLTNKDLDPKLRDEYLKEQKTLVAEGEAEKRRLRLDEAEREAGSLLDIEKGIAASRLVILKAGAVDAAGVWRATEQEINTRIGNQIADIEQKLKGPGLSENDRAALGEQKATLELQRPAEISAAKRTFNQNQQMEQHSIHSGLLGSASGMLGDLKRIPGADSPQLEKLDKMLSITQESASRMADLDRIIGSNYATKDQKAQAAQEKGMLSSMTSMQLSDKSLNMQEPVPLRLASAEYASDRYSGVAEYAKEADAASDADDAKADAGQFQPLIDFLNQNVPLWIHGGGAAPVQVPPHTNP